MTLHELTATPPTLRVVPDVRPLCRPLPPSSVRRARLVRQLARQPLLWPCSSPRPARPRSCSNGPRPTRGPSPWLPLTGDNDPVQLLAAIAARLDEIAGFVRGSPGRSNPRAGP